MKKKVDEAQRIGELWRLYLKEAEARLLLLGTGINLRGIQITLRENNPYLLPGQEYLATTRLFVRIIPLFDNDVITSYLKDMGIKMQGPLKYVRARTPQGKLTNFKTGDRFVVTVFPPEPLPKKKPMGSSLLPYIIRSKSRL